MSVNKKDYRSTKATLAYRGKPFSIPKNLNIIGMINTAVRTFINTDYTLRHRSGFFELYPEFGGEGLRNMNRN
jgi:5-methylcytosine-specific restriction endonuclease McrBC GTP-binding regulatory subunit McrB